MTIDEPANPNATPPPDAPEEPTGGEPDADPQADPQEIRRFTIRKTVSGRRLDKYLQGQLLRVSRTLLQRWIKQGLVTVNAMPTKASYEPKTGDHIEVIMPPPPPSDVVPENIPLDILYEDDYMLAINKQAGIICHPAHPSQTGTIANAVAGHADRLSSGTDPFRPGIVHRLDKNTTGVMLIAKCDEAHWRISLQFERRTIRKQYFAVCAGEISLDADIIDKPLSIHPDTTERMVLPGVSPPRQAMFKQAVTEYRVHTRYAGFTTVDLFPKTGRTHQLRVHMASIGHPLVGDTLYGGPRVTERDLSGRGDPQTHGDPQGHGDPTPLIEHQALHACRLRLVHPILETPLDIRAPLSPKIQHLVDLLEQHRKR